MALFTTLFLYPSLSRVLLSVNVAYRMQTYILYYGLRAARFALAFHSFLYFLVYYLLL